MGKQFILYVHQNELPLDGSPLQPWALVGSAFD